VANTLSLTIKLNHPTLDAGETYSPEVATTSLYGRLYESNGGQPTGDLIAETSVLLSGLVSGGKGYYTLMFTGLELTEGTPYVVLIFNPTYIEWLLNGNPYGIGGVNSYHTDNGVWYKTLNMGTIVEDSSISATATLDEEEIYAYTGGAEEWGIYVDGDGNSQNVSFTFTGPAAAGPKAKNPTPEHEEQDVVTEPSILLEWEPGDSENPPDSYKVYVGGGLSLELQDEVTDPSYSYTGRIFGPSTEWRVDSIYGDETVKGDEWKFFPESFSFLVYDLPNNPTPIDNSGVGKLSNGVRCKWDGDSTATNFRLFRSINGGPYEEVT
jgi:hypothetical protein